MRTGRSKPGRGPLTSKGPHICGPFVMRLTGALSNPALLDIIKQLIEKKAGLLERMPARAKARPRLLKLRQGAIQAAVLDVLQNHGKAMRGKEIYLGVEALLGRKVSRDSVYSYLSVASRDETSEIRKVGYERYGTFIAK